MDHPPLSDQRKEGPKKPASDLAFLSGGGQMGELIRAKDWSKTSLGPIESWPQSLRTTVSLCLASNFPISIVWGPQRVQIYNDGYWPICAAKHPHSMGQDFKECWFSAWPVIGEAFERAWKGETSFLVNRRLFVDRLGYLEETFFTFSFSPIMDESGDVGGLFHPVTELTQQSLAERRLNVLRDLADHTAAASLEEALTRIGQTLTAGELDVPFALIYRREPDGKVARLTERVGLEAGSAPAAERVTLDGSADSPWPLAEADVAGKTLVVENLAERFGSFQCQPYDESPRSAIVQPIHLPGLTQTFGFMVAGVSPRRPLDDPYRLFYNMLGEAVANALAKARAYEEERKRAEALAELDLAKTAFFSNVSHELRTPLTLILGPLEELKAQLGRSTSSLDAAQYQQVELVHRNGLRLLKLVNTLLDFSRIEAGRTQAVYEETNLAAFTADLASVFRSTIEKAGLSLIVYCPSLPEPVFVDRDMWEKIVLNLLSNAFKFTFEGEIEVALRHSGKQVELSVRDTGTGIPEYQLGKIFERFHRVAGSQGRTYEGTGIGLSLVQELARLHGGSVSVESVYGKGSTFRVRIPLGKSHLPHTHIGATRDKASTALGAMPFVEEAARWLPDEDRTEVTETASFPLSPQHSVLGTEVTRPRVLLADDNADMREYVRRLLSSQGYEVEAVADGQTALDRAHAKLPDLVLTDVMMPRLDGFGFLRALRNTPATKTIPVILLSARAGEEARVEGLGAGADDYLIKPFHARELLARVETHVKMARTRHEAQAALRESEGRFRSMADTAPAMLWVTEPNGSCSFLSRGWYEFTGQTEEEGLGKQGMGWLDATHPEDRERSSRLFLDANENRRPFTLEYRLRHHDGEYRWAIDAGRPRFGPTGEFLGYIGSVLDITERKRAEDALRESEERFARFMQHLPGLAWVKDEEGRYVYANDAAQKAFHVPKERLYGRTDEEVFPPEAAAQFRENDRRALISKTGVQVVETLEHEDGVIHHSLVSKFPIPGLDGQTRLLGGMAIDITERKQVEKALREGEERFRTLSEAVPAMVWICRPDGYLLHLNQRWIEYTSQTETEYQGYGWADTMHPDDRPRILAQWERCTRTGELYEGEVRYRRRDGQYRWHYFRGVPLREGGRIIAWYGTSLDIQEKKIIEDALRESEERFRMLLGTAPMGVFVCDKNAVIQYYNERAVELWGREPERGVEQHCGSARLWLPDGTLLPHTLSPIVEVLRTGVPVHNVEVFIERPDGTQLPVLVNFAALKDAQGTITGAITSFQDITERKQAEEALHRMNDELEQRVSERTYDLAQSEDRLRSLATELNLAEQRERTRLATELHDYLAQLLVLGRLTLGQAKRIGLPPRGEGFINETEEILNKALTYCRTLMAELNPPVLHNQGLAAGLKWLSEYMKKHQIAVTVTVPEKEDLKLREDQAVLLFQSVRELLMNICKHAGIGEAAIVLEQTDDTLRITVSDQGAGFDFAAAAADNASPLSSKYGLFSIRERMKALGGNFDVRSAQGQGTMATLSLPVTVKPLEKSGERETTHGEREKGINDQVFVSSRPTLTTDHSPRQKHTIRVLLVDDHLMMRQGLRSIVAAYDRFEVVGEAGDGAEAIELAKRLNPDVVVMDMNMPKMDGIEATRHIKANQPTTVVIGLSVNQSADAEQRMKAAGAAAYLTKENAVDALCHAIEQAVSYNQPTVARPVH